MVIRLTFSALLHDSLPWQISFSTTVNSLPDETRLPFMNIIPSQYLLDGVPASEMQRMFLEEDENRRKKQKREDNILYGSLSIALVALIIITIIKSI